MGGLFLSYNLLVFDSGPPAPVDPLCPHWPAAIMAWERACMWRLGRKPPDGGGNYLLRLWLLLVFLQAAKIVQSLLKKTQTEKTWSSRIDQDDFQNGIAKGSAGAIVWNAVTVNLSSSSVFRLSAWKNRLRFPLGELSPSSSRPELEHRESSAPAPATTGHQRVPGLRLFSEAESYGSIHND